MLFYKGATEEEIFSFEKKNNITLPEKYKELLRFSDGGEIFFPDGVILYGVAHRPLIKVKIKNRPDDTYFAIGKLFYGDPILAKSSGEEVFIYNLEDEMIGDEIYPDFFNFLNDLYELLGIDDCE